MIVGVDRRHGPLQALAHYYTRMPGAEAQGWSREKFGWGIVLDADGEPVDRLHLHDLGGRKPVSKLYEVPASFPRPGTTPRAFFLWDKTPFSLGVTKALIGKGWQAAPRQHEAFRTLHLEQLAEADDEGLVALRTFLLRWTPARFDAAPFVPEMLDANIMFRLDGDDVFLHERPAARRLVEVLSATSGDPGTACCLVTGERGQVARLHPTIKGVEGSNTSGASLVSFNLEAFESYGQAQGDNAPTSATSAFRYGTVLNRFLARDSRNRVKRPIGDATVAFWADASNARAAETADQWFSDAFTMEVEDNAEARKVGEELEGVAKGLPLSTLRPGIEQGTRFHVLGLSPNAARLSVRYWLSDDLDVFAKRLAEHYADLKIDPVPWGKPPAINYLLAQTTAIQGKFDNIPPLLAGEVMRAVLTGTRYPRAWLVASIMRLRAGDDPTRGWHAAAIRAVLARESRRSSTKRGAPVSLDTDETNEAYRLGRLFAVLEHLQERAIEGAKATIRSRFLASASAAPAAVFPTLLRLSQHHIVKLTNAASGHGAKFHDKQIRNVLDGVPSRFPRFLKLEDQGRFYIGYYHQRSARFRKKDRSGRADAAVQGGSDAE